MKTAKKKTVKTGAKQAPVNGMAELLEGIGESIYLARSANRLNKSQLAEKSGVSIVTIRQLEEKKAGNVSLETLHKLAEALGMEIVLSIS